MRNAYRICLALATLLGVAALFFLLRDPSMDRNAQFFGYSLSRLGIASVTLLVIFVFAFFTFKSIFDESWLDRVHLWLQTTLLQGDRMLVLTLTLSVLILVGFVLNVIWSMPIIHDFIWYSGVFKNRLDIYELLLVVIDRLLPLLIWITLVMSLALIALIAVFRDHYQKAGFWNWQVVSKTMLVLSMLLLSIIHWSILALGVSVKKLLPGWYWDVLIRPLSERQVLFLVLLVISLLLVRWILRHPHRIALNLLVVIALGYLIQVGFGFIEGQGYEYIRRKYADTGHRSYVNIAVSDFKDPLSAIREYEQRYGQKMFPGTKPPGVVLFYILLENVVNTVSHENTGEGRFLLLTRFMAFFFPLVALLVVALIYLFNRQLVEVEKAMLPVLLFIFIPNITLIPLYLDQVLYPLLFMLGVLLLWRVLKGRSLLLAFTAGVYIYVAVFFTFAMVPLLPFFMLLVGLDYVFNRQRPRIIQPVLLVAVLGLGILTALIAFRLFLNYDILLRYETANRIVRNFDFVIRTGGKYTEELSKTAVRPGLSQILRAGFLNNLEFAAAVGFPVFLLFIWGVFRTASALIRRRGKKEHVALAALFLTYLALNVYGQMQGEAARLWMFWVPMVVSFAGFELYSHFHRKNLVVYLVVTLQFITIWMTFMFQDFIV